MPMTELQTHPKNPRRGDVAGIQESLRRFGQVRPLLVLPHAATPGGVIVAGNHTFRAMEAEGFTEAWAVIVDLTSQEAEAYALADNRLSDKAGYDDQALVAALNDLNLTAGLEGTGYSVDDMEDLLATIESVPETKPEPFTGGYAEPEEETAARWEGRNEGARREVVFLLLEEEFEQFNQQVTELQKRWGAESKAQTIAAAVTWCVRNESIPGVITSIPSAAESNGEQRVTIEPIVEGTETPGAE